MGVCQNGTCLSFKKPIYPQFAWNDLNGLFVLSICWIVVVILIIMILGWIIRRRHCFGRAYCAFHDRGGRPLLPITGLPAICNNDGDRNVAVELDKNSQNVVPGVGMNTQSNGGMGVVSNTDGVSNKKNSILSITSAMPNLSSNDGVVAEIPEIGAHVYRLPMLPILEMPAELELDLNGASGFDKKNKPTGKLVKFDKELITPEPEVLLDKREEVKSRSKALRRAD